MTKMQTKALSEALKNYIDICISILKEQASKSGVVSFASNQDTEKRIQKMKQDAWNNVINIIDNMS